MAAALSVGGIHTSSTPGVARSRGDSDSTSQPLLPTAPANACAQSREAVSCTRTVGLATGLAAARPAERADAVTSSIGGTEAPSWRQGSRLATLDQMR